MKKVKINKKAIIIIVIILLVIIAIIKIIYKKNKKNTTDEESNQSYAQVMEDTSKVNISEKMKETKDVDGLQVSNIKITETDNISSMKANITNTTSSEIPDTILEIKFVNKAGNEIVTVSGYVGKISPGETVPFEASIAANFADAYDCIITRRNA